MRWLTEPVVIEILFAAVLTVVIVLAVRRMARIASYLDQRRALRDYVGGLDLHLLGEHARSVEMLEKVIERDPENPEARIALGDGLRALGRVDEAHRQHYHVESVLQRELPRNRISLARDFLALGRHDDAIPLLDSALDAGPFDRAAACELRDACLAVGRYDRAVDVARQVLADTEADSTERNDARRALGRALTLAGEACLDRGEGKAGTGLLEEAVRTTPELVQPRMLLVRARLIGGDARSAEKAFAKALAEMRRLAESTDVVFEPTVEGAAPVAIGAMEDNVDNASRVLPAPRVVGELRAPTNGDGGDEVEDAIDVEARPVSHLPARRDGAPPVTRTRETLLPAIDFSREDVARLLDRAATVFCSECGRTAGAWSERCPGCGDWGTLVPRDVRRLEEVPRIGELLDEIDESRPFQKRLAKAALAGDVDAASRLVEAGARVVPTIFATATASRKPRPLIECLVRMGPRVLPDVIEAWRRARPPLGKKMLGEGARRARAGDAIVVRVISGMGEGTRDTLLELLDRPEREFRRLALDAMLRLGLTDLIEQARLVFSAKEFVDRINKLGAESIRRLIARAERGSYLVGTIFSDRTFRHDEALVDAISWSESREVVVEIIRRRGFSPTTVDRLLVQADLPALREIAFDLIAGFGDDASDHLLGAFVDPDRSAETRAGAGVLLQRVGVPSFEKLLDGAADRPATVADQVVAFLVTMGASAVDGLQRAYTSGGFLGRIGLGREKIRARRVLVVRVLRGIGGRAPLMALRELRLRESDPELRSAVDDAIADAEEHGD